MDTLFYDDMNCVSTFLSKYNEQISSIEEDECPEYSTLFCKAVYEFRTVREFLSIYVKSFDSGVKSFSPQEIANFSESTNYLIFGDDIELYGDFNSIVGFIPSGTFVGIIVELRTSLDGCDMFNLISKEHKNLNHLMELIYQLSQHDGMKVGVD